MTTTYAQGVFRIGATKEIRFAGTEFIKERIERKLQKKNTKNRVATYRQINLKEKQNEKNMVTTNGRKQ